MTNTDINNRDIMEISIPDILNGLKEHIVAIILAAIAGIIIGIVCLMTITPLYKSEVSVWVKPIKTSGSLSSLVGDVAGSSNSKINTEVEFLQSRKVLQSAFETLDLSKYSDNEGKSYEDLEFGEYYKGKDKKIEVKSNQNVDIVTISVKDANADFAADYANAIAECYINELSELTREAKKNQCAALEHQIPENKALLEEARAELLDYSNKYGTAEITAKMEAITAYVAQIQLLEGPLLVQKAEIIDQLEEFKDEKYLYDDFLQNASLYDSYEQYISAAKEYYYYTCASNATDDRLLTVKDLMVTLTREIYNIVEPLCISVDYAYYVTSLLTLDVKMDVLAEIEDEYKAYITSYQDILAGLTERQSKVDLYQSLLLTLSELLEQTKVVASSSESDASLVDKAFATYIPVNISRVKFLFISIFACVFIACCIIAAITILDTGVYSDSDVKDIVGDKLQPIGWIPYRRFHHARKNRSSSIGLLSIEEPESVIAERYRILAANIGLSAPDAKVIVFNSMGIGNGKSTVLSNVSCCYASMGKRVLVIDGDLRRPQLERTFDLVKQTKGVVNVMNGEDVLGCIVRPVEKLPNLHMLPAGRVMRNPNIVYNSAAFSNMLTSLRDIYDYIFIDCPPLSYGSDFMLLSKNIDAYAIIIRAGVADRASVASIIPAISEIKAKLLGYIFYGVLDTADSGNYGYSYGYGYGYGGYNRYDGYGNSTNETGKKSKKSMYARQYKDELKYRTDSTRHYGTVVPTYAYADGKTHAFGDLSESSILDDVLIPSSLSAIEQDSMAFGKANKKTK